MMEGANSLNQQDPIGIQNGLVPGNQEEQPSSLLGVNLFASQYRPLKDDGSYLLQAEQYVVPVSQGISTQDSENNMVSSQAPERTENPDYDAQLVNLRKANDKRAPMSAVSNQQALTMAINNQEFVATGIGNQSTTNTLNREMLFRCIEVLLAILFEHDKDRAKQLSADYLLLTKRVISEHEFLRCMISIAREPMIKAAYKMLSQVLQLQPQVSAQQQNLPTPCTVEITTDLSNQAADNSNRPNSLKVERLPDSHGMQLSQMSSSSSTAIQDRECTALTPHGLNKQKPQHMHFSHASFSTHGNISSVAMNANNSASPLMQLSHDSRMRPIPDHQIISPTQLEATTQGIDMGLSYFSSINVGQGNILLGTLVDEYLKMNSSSVGFSVSPSAVPSNPVSLSMPNHMDTNNSLNSRIPSASSPIQSKDSTKTPRKSSVARKKQLEGLGSSPPPSSTSSSKKQKVSRAFPEWSGNSAKTPAKPSVGRKKPLEALGSSPPPSSKKQKESQAFSDQSIEQLNDVIDISGVNIREEEEQLFSDPMVDSHISEASALVVQEEEDRLILEKNPLQKKLVEIIGKYGLKSISNDVERCLSLCVEERLRGLIRNLVRLSKQRLDTEKPRHKIIITSDISQQIMLINRKAQEESEKNLAEVEKLQKLNEATGNTRVDGKKEKDEDCGNRKQDNNMFTKAANVAARAAVGGVDMLSKWQLMAEQAKQKREEGTVAAPGLQPGGQKLSSSRSSKDNHKMETRAHSAANSIPVREAGRMQAVGAHSEDAHTISVRDVVAALEREPQMSKSTFLYQLYEKLP